MIIKTVVPSIVKKYFNDNSSNFDLNNVVKKSRGTFFHLIGAPAATWTTPFGVFFPGVATYVPNTKKVLEFRLAVTNTSETVAVDCKFNFDNISFSNSINVTSANLWKKSTDYNTIKNSIQSMFQATGVLDNWTLSWVYPGFQPFTSDIQSYNYRCINFKLTRKVDGDYQMQSTMVKMESLLDNIWLNNDITIFATPTYPNYIKELVNGDPAPNIAGYNTYFDYRGASFNAMIREYYSLGANLLDDLNFYEIGLDIFSVKFPWNQTYLSSISKRLVSLGDFEPSFITRDYIDNYKPTFGSFNFAVSKYLDTFQLRPFQSYIDPTIPNNSFKTKQIMGSGVPNFTFNEQTYSITYLDAWNDLFDNYESNSGLVKDFNYKDDYYTQVTSSTYDIGSGFNGNVNTIATASDGTYLVGGKFMSYNTQPAKKLIKLNSDGSINTGFSASVGTEAIGYQVNTIKETVGSKILIGGLFISYDSNITNYVTRLNSDGSLDNTFTNFTGTSSLNSQVKAIDVQYDGKILLGGNFTTFQGVSASYIVRLNSDGTRDFTFDTRFGFNTTVNVIKSVGTHSIFVGGQFTSYKGMTAGRIINLNFDGSINQDIRYGSGFNSTVYDMDIEVSTIHTGTSSIYQYPFSMIVGGDFTLYGGGFTFSGSNLEASQKQCNKFVRLLIGKVLSSNTPYTLTNYSIPFFRPGVGDGFVGKFGTADSVRAVKMIPGGFLIGGRFPTFGGINSTNFVYTDLNAKVLNTKIPGGSNAQINSVAYISGKSDKFDGQIAAGGLFTSFNSSTKNRINFMNISGDDFKVISNVPRLLTNQPLSKKLNSGYEIVSCLSSKFNAFKTTKSLTPDLVNIKGGYIGLSSSISLGTFSCDNTTLSSENNMYVNTLVFKVDNFLSNLSATSSTLKYLDFNFKLIDHEQGVYLDGPTQRYLIDSVALAQVGTPCASQTTAANFNTSNISIVFKNKEGGYDLFEFEAPTQIKSNRGINTFQKSYNHTDSSSSDFNSIYAFDYNKVYSSVTRILNDEEFTWLEELGKSRHVYVLRSDLKLYPIVLTNWEYITQINTDKIINIEFEYSRPQSTY